MQLPYRNHWFQMNYDKIIDEYEHEPDIFNYDIEYDISHVQSTSLLYEEYQTCQEEK